MADVLLTHSYHLHYDRKQTRKMQPYPPLGTLYAAALLRSAGLSVALFDTMLNDPKRGFQAALEKHRPRVVVVYEDNFNFLTKMCLTRMREVAYHILEVSQATGAIVLANGSDASDHALDYLRQGFRYVLLGEAEWTLLEATQHLLRGGDRGLAHIPGLAYLDEETGALARTPPRPLTRNLDLMSFSCPRSDRCRTIPYSMEGCTRLFLDEYRRQSWLPLSLQLVRKAHLWRLLCRAVGAERCGRDANIKIRFRR